MKLIRYFSSIKYKLIAILLTILTIPLVGIKSIVKLHDNYQYAQHQSILENSKFISAVLSSNPEMFNQHLFDSGSTSQNLYSYPIPYALSVDDNSLHDWKDYQQYEVHYEEGSSAPNPQNQFTSFRNTYVDSDVTNISGSSDPLSYRVMIGENDDFVSLYLRIQDENIVYSHINGPGVHNSDGLRLSLLNEAGFKRFMIVAAHPGEIAAYGFIGNTDSPNMQSVNTNDVINYDYDPQINGRWSLHALGYDIEIRLPTDMLGSTLSLAVIDVDNPQSHKVEAVVATAELEDSATLGQLFRPHLTLSALLSRIASTSSNTSISILDISQRLLIKTSLPAKTTRNMPKEDISPWLRMRQQLLHPLYLPLINKLKDSLMITITEQQGIIAALTGEAASFTQLEPETNTTILSAAYPVVKYDKQQVMGAVLVNQSTDPSNMLFTTAVAEFLDAFLAIFIIILILCGGYAAHLSRRIKRLRGQAESSIDERGRISNNLVASSSYDEIGQLSRSFNVVLARFSQYTDYLQNMSSRLSHELRTPVTIVSSSLDNLRLLGQNDEADIYIERAEQGIARLSLILTNMSEASRLEQILQTADKETLDLNHVLAACIQGYRQVYPQNKILLTLVDQPLLVLANADYLVQLMDKLVANAVEFSEPNLPLRISSNAVVGEATISVINNGPYLANEMQDRIFELMVSLRPEGKDKQPHLGMGLPIARMIAEFHQGDIYAENLLEEEGVLVVVRLPLVS